VEPGANLIRELLPRRSLFSKADARGKSRPLAANLDQVLVTLATEPEADLFLLDKYLAAVAGMGIEAGIVFNKTDLLASLTSSAHGRLGYYRGIGYRVFEVSARGGAGLDGLKLALAGRASLLAGQSGVGKSSLLNALVPEARRRIDALSEATGEGRHTTTVTTLHPLPGGGVLLDSPGVRDLALPHVAPRQLAKLFMEFPRHGAGCRFPDCLHAEEPGCAVQTATQRGEILESRYANYMKLLRAMKKAEKQRYD
jgi:ribosome biogenesis GTPase